MMSWLGLVVFSLAPAHATEPEQLFLVSEQLAVGIHPSGSLGNPDQELGLLGDPDPESSEIPVGGDLLWVGDPFETWTLELVHDGTTQVLGGLGESVYASADGIEIIEFDWGEITEGSNLSVIEGTATHELLEIRTQLVLSWSAPILWIDVEITATEDLESLWLNRSFDPDPDAWLDGSYASVNEAGDGFAMGAGQWDGRTLALVGPGTGGICTWCIHSSSILAGSTESTGDDQLGLAMEIGSLAAGEVTELRMVYALAMTAEEARSQALVALASLDRDGDGHEELDGDCDDTASAIHPEAFEYADGIDNDCDGEIDETGETDTDTSEEGLDPLPSDQDWTWSQENPGGCSAAGPGRWSLGFLVTLCLAGRRREQ